MSDNDLGFVHKFIPGTDGSGLTLLVLHGTGGNENDLVPLAREISPGAAILSPRGKVLEHGMPRFFRRLAEGVFDHEDLARRTEELAEFIRRAIDEYDLDPDRIVAMGYSNGANIAASLMLTDPGVLRAAVLFRAMVPFEPEDNPDLSGTSIFLAAGTIDQMIPPDNARRLAEILQEAGADLDVRWREVGHGLTYEEIEEAREWLRKVTDHLG